MVMTRVVATPNASHAAAANSMANTIGVALYHKGSASLPGLGSQLPKQIEDSFPAPPSQAAWDFLSLSLAIFAADRFVLRSDAEDSWTRVISLEVALANPNPWKAHLPRLASALRFLTGDIWQLNVRNGGSTRTIFSKKESDRDTVCLFSGGLDSFLGAAKLVQDGRRPFLVSQGSQKEIKPQRDMANSLQLGGSYRFEGRVSERGMTPYEGSTRARSIVFFAYGVAAVDAHGLSELIVPENGLIAINPPLTPRRLGSLSTRTTHPHFLSELELVLKSVGLGVHLRNPFEGITKGEMLKGINLKNLQALASQSYSCGKGKRLNGQCGLCIPCIIRQAAFNASGIADNTLYKKKISSFKRNDDVLAARIATARFLTLSNAETARWVATAGQLPSDPKRKQSIVGGVTRGMKELSDFLNGIRWQ